MDNNIETGIVMKGDINRIELNPTHAIVVEVLTNNGSVKKLAVLMDANDHWNGIEDVINQIDAVNSCINSKQLEFIERETGISHRTKVYKLEGSTVTDLGIDYCPIMFGKNNRY